VCLKELWLNKNSPCSFSLSLGAHHNPRILNQSRMQTVRSLILGVKLWSGRNKFSSERIIKCKRNKLGFQTLSHRITGKTRLNAAESELMLSTFSLSHSIEWPKKHQSAVRCSAARKSRMDLFVPWLLGYQAHIHLAHPTVGCSGQVLHKVSELERERQ
jgi:hypothetical protein